jgi:hypothetical protein
LTGGAVGTLNSPMSSCITNGARTMGYVSPKGLITIGAGNSPWTTQPPCP